MSKMPGMPSDRANSPTSASLLGPPLTGEVSSVVNDERSAGLGRRGVDPVGDAAAMKVAVPVLRFQGTAALEPEVEIVLPGEADATVDLERLIVGAPLRIPGIGLGHRDV